MSAAEFLNVPEPYQDGVDSPVKFLRRYNEQPSVGEDIEAKVHMDSDFAQLFWDVAARYGYEAGVTETAKAVADKHTEMSAELSVLRDNRVDPGKIAELERNLHEATTGLAEQRQQIIDMEKERQKLREECERLSFLLNRQLRRSPTYRLSKWLERLIRDSAQRWFYG